MVILKQYHNVLRTVDIKKLYDSKLLPTDK